MLLHDNPDLGGGTQAAGLEQVVARFKQAKKVGRDKWMAFCQSHDDGEKSGKRSLSLRIVRDGEPKILAKCLAGCATEAAVAAAGLTMADLFERFERKAPRGSAGRTLVATYNYRDPAGELKYQTLRYEPKGFSQRRPDGHDAWIWSLKGVEPLLYRLDQLMKSKSRMICLTEGERDADTLAALDLASTTNHGGSGYWTDAHTAQLAALKPERVVIFEDNDEAGRKRTTKVAPSLMAVGLEVKVITGAELVGLPEKGDISDWLTAGHTRDELLAVIEKTGPYLSVARPVCKHRLDIDEAELEIEQQAAPREKGDLTRYEFSDLGNAERLLACYGDRIRYCSAIGWLMWDRRRWRAMMHSKQGDHLAVMQLAIKAIRTFKEQCVDIADPKRAAQAFKHALTSEGLFRLQAMVELAKGFVEIKMEKLDQDEHLLNVANSTLDLRTGKLREHRKDDYLTRVLPIEYHPAAPAPIWVEFLDTIMAGNVALIGYLQRGVGYSLIGLLRDHVIFIPYGVGSNGKSTFLGTIAYVLGEYAQGMAPETLMSKKYEGIPNDIARLKGTRFVSAIETKRGRQLDESVVKKLTGGDTLTGRFLHKEFFDFMPTHKLWFGTNHKPVIKDTTLSIWRRVNLIPFTVVIPDAEQDKALGASLRAEAQGILAWAVEGCRQWMAGGLQTPQEVLVATEQYRQEQDALAEFVALTIEVWPRGWVTIEDIGKAYEDWAIEYGGAEHQGEGQRSTRDITSYLVSTYALTRASKKVDGRAHKVLLGIRLRPPVTEVTDVPVVSMDLNSPRNTGNSVTTVTATPRADTNDLEPERRPEDRDGRDVTPRPVSSLETKAIYPDYSREPIQRSVTSRSSRPSGEPPSGERL